VRMSIVVRVCWSLVRSVFGSFQEASYGRFQEASYGRFQEASYGRFQEVSYLGGMKPLKCETAGASGGGVEYGHIPPHSKTFQV
jgi:hypothetical protein